MPGKVNKIASKMENYAKEAINCPFDSREHEVELHIILFSSLFTCDFRNLVSGSGVMKSISFHGKDKRK